MSTGVPGTVTPTAVGTEETVLVVLRGNSASGKSSVAAGLRARFGQGLAVVGQDNLRRTVLRERDRPGAANIDLISAVARYALDAGYHVIVEGILYADHYGEMLARLMTDHRGATYAYYLHVPFAETLARHASKPQTDEYGEAEMRVWYREMDLLPGRVETVIGHDSSLPQSIDRILLDSGPAGSAARDR
jgi:predicted kinase